MREEKEAAGHYAGTAHNILTTRPPAAFAVVFDITARADIIINAAAERCAMSARLSSGRANAAATTARWPRDITGYFITTSMRRTPMLIERARRARVRYAISLSARERERIAEHASAAHREKAEARWVFGISQPKRKAGARRRYYVTSHSVADYGSISPREK